MGINILLSRYNIARELELFKDINISIPLIDTSNQLMLSRGALYKKEICWHYQAHPHLDSIISTLILLLGLLMNIGIPTLSIIWTTPILMCPILRKSTKTMFTPPIKKWASRWPSHQLNLIWSKFQSKALSKINTMRLFTIYMKRIEVTPTRFN